MNLNQGGHRVFVINSQSIHSFESYDVSIPYYANASQLEQIYH